MMGEAKRLDPLVINAIKKLRASGKFKVAALTNNYTPAEGAEKGESVLSSSNPENVELRTLFHEFVESSKTGMRKPNPQIYIYTCDSVGVKPHEAIFLDDIGTNLKAAKKLGMATIRKAFALECRRGARTHAFPAPQRSTLESHVTLFSNWSS